jgi:hypothetical protein
MVDLNKLKDSETIGVPFGAEAGFGKEKIDYTQPENIEAEGAKGEDEVEQIKSDLASKTVTETPVVDPALKEKLATVNSAESRDSTLPPEVRSKELADILNGNSKLSLDEFDVNNLAMGENPETQKN